MNVTYDPATGTGTVLLRQTRVAESDEPRPGVIFDDDEAGELVRLEILDASRRLTGPASFDDMEYRITR